VKFEYGIAVTKRWANALHGVPYKPTPNRTVPKTTVSDKKMPHRRDAEDAEKNYSPQIKQMNTDERQKDGR
jgi:hypothetical protein